MSSERRAFWSLTLLALILSCIPVLVGIGSKPEGGLYLGVQTNLDDHAVYAAWMKQAQEGRLLFENRFTTEQQSGLTLHAYFWALGNLSRVTGIPVAMHLGRILFALLFCALLWRTIGRYGADLRTRTITYALCLFGAGFGWAVFRQYGVDAPIDGWQPEAFTFPSILTNGLFCVSLWLILIVWNAILDSRDSWRPVLHGALAALLLTNVHTYDMLTVGLVAVGFAVSCVASRTASGIWAFRCAVIALGALPSLAWHLYVLSVDPVFAERAATFTPSPKFLWVLLGYAPLLFLALVYWSRTRLTCKSYNVLLTFGVAALCMLLVAITSNPVPGKLPLELPVWAALFAAMCVACWFCKTESPHHSLLFAWMALGLITIYAPGLFQRKLAMGLQIPICIAAGLGLSELVRKWAVMAVIPVGAVMTLSLTSLSWIRKEVYEIRSGLSNTTRHSVYLSREEADILRQISRATGPSVFGIAFPGASAKVGEDDYALAINDLNPYMAGWGGMKVYAGHWSETPNYSAKYSRLVEDFYLRRSASTESRLRFLASAAPAPRINQSGPTSGNLFIAYAVIPIGESAEAMGIAPLEDFLQVPGAERVWTGASYALIRCKTQSAVTNRAVPGREDRAAE